MKSSLCMGSSPRGHTFASPKPQSNNSATVLHATGKSRCRTIKLNPWNHKLDLHNQRSKPAYCTSIPVGAVAKQKVLLHQSCPGISLVLADRPRLGIGLGMFLARKPLGQTIADEKRPGSKMFRIVQQKYSMLRSVDFLLCEMEKACLELSKRAATYETLINLLR